MVAWWTAPRPIAGAAPAWLAYARDDGLASPLLTTPASRLVALALVPAAAVAAAGIGWPGAVAVASRVLAGVGVLGLAQLPVGGVPPRALRPAPRPPPAPGPPPSPPPPCDRPP